MKQTARGKLPTPQEQHIGVFFKCWFLRNPRFLAMPK